MGARPPLSDVPELRASLVQAELKTPQLGQTLLVRGARVINAQRRLPCSPRDGNDGAGGSRLDVSNCFLVFVVWPRCVQPQERAEAGEFPRVAIRSPNFWTPTCRPQRHRRDLKSLKTACF